jgi:hypothetical protein
MGVLFASISEVAVKEVATSTPSVGVGVSVGVAATANPGESLPCAGWLGEMRFGRNRPIRRMARIKMDDGNHHRRMTVAVSIVNPS